MFEKIDLNNALIHMKPSIRKAKVCVISKIVKKIKTAKTQSDKHPDNDKFNIRIRKLDAQIEAIKKLDTLDLTILVLTSVADPQKILTNPSSKPEDLIIAQIKLCKGIKESIESVREKLDLDNAVGWQNIVKEFGRKIKVTAKNKAKRLRIIKKIKEKKSKKEKKPEVEKGGDNAVKTEINKTKANNEWIIENIDKGETKTLINDSKNNKKDAKNVEKVKKKSVAKEKVTQEDIPEPPTKSMDSFFFTSTGVNYMATAVPERIQLTNETAVDQWTDRKSKHDNYQKFHNLNQERNSTNFTGKPIKNSFNSNKHKNESNDLHPSWSAKRQMNGAIGKFAGTKIKFDEEPNKAIDGDNKIHPSWAAKQKQKPIISEFKGTKITFDD